MSSLDADIAACKQELVSLKKEHPDWKTTPVPAVDAAVQRLKALLKQQKEEQKAAAAAPKPKKAAAAARHASGMQHRKEAGSFSDWYLECIFKGGLVSHYPVAGCYVIRPWAYALWECIQRFMDAEIKRKGVKNCYFPMFVTAAALQREEDHLEGFAPEVAWVTRSGETDLEQPIALRPTSECVMYPLFAQWITGARDLPLRVNQWSNIVRWESSRAQPFLRTREFLWQEGHSAFATRDEAVAEVYDVLDMYASTYEDLLAVPVIRGRKSEKEKFAGGDFTTTCEIYVPVSGRSIQGCTSHHLGQNFSRMFDITFEAKGEREHVWQNSWGFSTRSIGTVVMLHSDDRGLVLPPRATPLHVVIIPIRYGGDVDARIDALGERLCAALRKAGLEVRFDSDTGAHNSGYLRAHWELRGVPLRIEIGPRDVEKNAVLVCRRDTGAKESVDVDVVPTRVAALLDDMHRVLYERAKRVRDDNIVRIDRWEAFVPALDERKVVLAPWCDTMQCEEAVKKRSGEEAKAKWAGEEGRVTAGAKTLCLPFEGQLDAALTKLGEEAVCFQCGDKAKTVFLFGRSY